MKLALYRIATSLGGPLIWYYLNRRLKKGKEDSTRFGERFGTPSLPRPPGKLVWIHAASVGESLSILPFIKRLNQDDPTWQVLITTGSVTSAKLMKDRLPENARHQFVPVDRLSYVRQFLNHWQPDLALWMESEFWPNLVIETHVHDVPMVVVNGRMSERSFHGWQKHKSLIRRILTSFQMVLAQSDKDAERFLALGAPTVSVPGNIKFSGDLLPHDANDLKTLTHQIGGRPVWLASSTHDDEEILCARVHKAQSVAHKGLLTLIVPRHPHRGKTIARQIQDIGLTVSLRSAGQPITDQTDIYIADTMGELGLFYRLSRIVFIGKTLAKGGGQNPIEPALLDCALIFGPDMSNFADVAHKLIQTKGAINVRDEHELGEAIHTFLCDDLALAAARDNGKKIAQSEGHVLDRVVQDLKPFFDQPKTP